MRKQYAVFGLGNFGKHLALGLENLGCEVVVVDNSMEKIQEIADKVSYAMCANIEDPEVIKSLGARNLDGAVIAISENFGTSIMATIMAKEIGIPYVLAKAQSSLHATVLKKVGADAVVHPEKEMGRRIARTMVSGNFADWIELSPDYSLVETEIPDEWIGKRLVDLQIREKYGINVVGTIENGIGNMITSTSNPQVKNLLQLQKKSKVRNEEQVFIVEGLRMFMEVPQDQVKKVYVSESLYNKKKEELHLERFPVEVLADKVFQHVSDTKTPQGILCVVKQRKYEIEDLISKENPHFIVLDNLQDPGNLGTIVRTAEGAGVTAVFMSSDCVDIYNPKTIRSTMGSIYRVPFVYVDDLLALLDKFQKKKVTTYAAHLKGKNTYDKENYQSGTAVLIGNEGNGLRDEVAEKADVWVQIPMQGKVESLNAAIAASILMFEVYRQRR